MFVSLYVELHSHSAYSFLDGASLPEELVLAATRLGYDAMALTDHDSVSGSMEFAQAARSSGLRAIHGAEVTVVAGPRPPAGRDPGPDVTRHLTLLVQNARGWKSLCRLLTRAHEHTREHRQRQRTQPWVTIADVCHHHEGLVCLSGCADHGVRDEPTLRILRDAFGRDDLYVELQRQYLRGDRDRVRIQRQLARRLGLKCVATGNVHAHSRARARLQDAFVAIRHHTPLDASEPIRRGNHSHVLASPHSMFSRQVDQPDAVAESVRLADRLRFDLTEQLPYSYPGLENAKAGAQLTAVCRAAFDGRYPVGHRFRRPAEARLDEELRLIGKLGLDGFFLLHHEILELAREVAVGVRGGSAARSVLPPGRGRGSSVSSIVCYLTGLSHVDPIESGLSLGRFLHEDISGVPDIDLDFPRDVRAELIVQVHERYGTDRAALVAAFPTYRSRGAIRELGAALGLPAAELERVARGSEGWSAMNVAEDIATAQVTPHHGPRLRGTDENAPRDRWEWLAHLSNEAHGLPRHLSQHPGGMIIATRPLIDCCPAVPAAMAGRQMVMWDKDSCSDGGFLKIDLLGLGMLSCVERSVELISKRHPEQNPLDLSRIPLDDPQTFGAIQRAETTGVFQIESRAQMGSLLRTRPATLDELAIQVAIVRPGPIQGGAIDPYIDRLQRLRADPNFQITYLHHSLEPALRETLGTLIFQDQVIEVAQAFSGFTAGEAEGLRRAMSRKRSAEAIEAHHQQFVDGARKTHRDVTPETAEQVWDMVRGFAGFGFPKAHAAAFGLLAYQSTWLRVHHPVEFCVSLLNEQPMGFYPPDALIHDAQRRGITVLPPDVRTSDTDCTITDDGAIQIGLGYVKGVQADETDALVAERDAHGPWESLGNLATRLGLSVPSLERLAWAGACDELAGQDGVPVPRRRRAALWQVGLLTPGHNVKAGTQLALELTPGAHATPDLKDSSAWDRMIADYAATGLTTGPHPLALLRPQLATSRVLPSDQLPRTRHGSTVRVAGLVLARQRPASARGVTFLLLEDEEGTVNLVVPPAVYLRDRLVVRTEPLVAAEGRLERHAAGGGQINIVVRRVRALDDVLASANTPARRLHELSPEQLERWRQREGGQLRPTADGTPVPQQFRNPPSVQHFGQGRRGR